MRCKFCYAQWNNIDETILPGGHLPKKKSLQIIHELHNIGFKKITFAGGEPTLCPWLFELVELAHKLGINTTIITNASQFNEEKIAKFAPVLDWLGISIDSLKPKTNLKTGRAISGNIPLTKEHYYQIAKAVHFYGIKLKINTVVNETNYQEDMSGFILRIKPKRWKLFQVLPVIGQNDHSIGNLEIETNMFDNFVQRHKHLEEYGIPLVPENNTLMRGSYMLIDPSGRFYDDSKGYHTYSRPILDVGAAEALNDINTNPNTFIKRGGLYNW